MRVTIDVTLYPDSCYPCTISAARYGGAYEGDKWVAYPFYDVPPEAQDSDPVCRRWFEDNRWSVGVGPTPNDAIAHLIEQLRRAERSGRAQLTRMTKSEFGWVPEPPAND